MEKEIFCSRIQIMHFNGFFQLSLKTSANLMYAAA